MDEEKFYSYLKTAGRKKNVIEKYLKFIEYYEKYLLENKNIKQIQNASSNDLIDFVEHFEKTKKTSARTSLYAIMKYYKSISNTELAIKAEELREPRKTKKAPFLLKKMLGIDPIIVEKLKNIGISNVNQMIEAGKTTTQRLELSEKTGISYDIILELVKISDLNRIGYIRTKFTRLFYNAGIETPEELSRWEVEELRSHLNKYIKDSNWKGIAPYPSDLANYINSAKKLPQIIIYD